MGTRANARQRAVDAYGVLRGRPPKPDYGYLIVLPLAAAAGGALIALSVDMAVTRRTANRSGTSDPAPLGNLDSVSTAGHEPARR